jgi:hypothetical protein
LGDFLKLGGDPQTPGRKYPASLFQQVSICKAISETVKTQNTPLYPDGE